MTLLAHRLDGAGEPVLLLNGGLMSLAAWEPLAGALATSWRVVRCDLRGQLLSPGAAHPDLEGHADDVVALLDHLRIDRIHVVGTSFGGEVALLLAGRHPERVASLLLATVTDAATAEFAAGIRSMRQGLARLLAGGDPLDFWAEILPWFYSPGWLAGRELEMEARGRVFAGMPGAYFAGVDGLLRALERLDLRDLLPRITCPCLVLAAGEDRVMPASGSAALVRAIPGALLQTLEGSGHALVVERAEAFHHTCAQFLAEHASGGPGPDHTGCLDT